MGDGLSKGNNSCNSSEVKKTEKESIAKEMSRE